MVWKDRSGSINRYMFSRIPAVSALKYLVTIRIIYGWLGKANNWLGLNQISQQHSLLKNLQVEVSYVSDTLNDRYALVRLDMDYNICLT